MGCYFTEEEIKILAERFGALYSGVVYDALFEEIKPAFPFVLAREIIPTWTSDKVLCGPAFTVRGSILADPSKKKSITSKMMADMYPGCVEIISSASRNKIAIFGEITAMLCRRSGAIGTITDGCTRDVNALEKMDYIVYSMGVAMIDSQGKWSAVEYDVPIILDGAEGDVKIYPSDYIFADRDGVLVIPREKVWETLEAAERRYQKELRIREHVINGMDIDEIKQKEGRW